MMGHMAMGSAGMNTMQSPTFLHNLNTSLHHLNTSLMGQRIVRGLERNTPLVDRVNGLQDRAVLDRLAGPGLFPNPFTSGFGLNPFTSGFGVNPNTSGFGVNPNTSGSGVNPYASGSGGYSSGSGGYSSGSGGYSSGSGGGSGSGGSGSASPQANPYTDAAPFDSATGLQPSSTTLDVLGLPTVGGRLSWPLGLRVVAPAAKAQVLRRQIDAVLTLAAAPSAGGQLSSGAVELATSAAEQLRTLLRQKQGSAVMAERTYRDATAFLDRLQVSLLALKR
jgi:hypothetical protein